MPPMMRDIGTTMIPSWRTRSGGMEAALSVTTVTGMSPMSLRPRLTRQCDGGGDVGEMAHALGEVSEQLAGVHAVLLGEQAQIVGRRHCPLVDAAGLVEPALASQALDQPEGAGHEDPFLTVEAVLGA